MSPKLIVLDIIAVIAGAVIGLLVATFAGWLFSDVGFLATLALIGPFVLALVTVAIYAVLYAKISTTPAALASLAVGIVLPTIIQRFAFDAVQGWTALLALNLVFAVVSLLTYRLVYTSAGARAAAAEVSDRL